MDVSVEDIVGKMLQAGEAAFKDGWASVRNYAPAEFKKMAVQIADIAKNVAAYEINNDEGYSPETGKILFQMQRRSLEAVLVAVTELTLIAVQDALNAILKVLEDAFDGVLKAFL